MDQYTNNRTVGLCVGMLLLLLSLPTTWIYIENLEAARVAAVFGAQHSVPVTGLDGNLSVLTLNLPIWLVITFGLISQLLILLNQRRITALPRFSFIVPGVISAVYVSCAFYIGASSGEVTISIGSWLAAIGLGIGVLVSMPEYRGVACSRQGYGYNRPRQ